MTPAEWWQDLDGWEGILLAVGVVTTAVGSILGARWAYLSRRHAKGAEQQVSNDHAKNMRDDLDDKFDSLGVLVRSQGHQIGEIHDVIQSLARTVADNTSRQDRAIERLEEVVIGHDRTLRPPRRRWWHR